MDRPIVPSQEEMVIYPFSNYTQCSLKKSQYNSYFQRNQNRLYDGIILLEPKGDPMSLLNWTSKSVAHLTGALQAMGRTIADTALRDVLLSPGYSLRANKKTMEGNAHEDRDAQFAHIKERCEQFEQAGNPT